MKTYAMVDNINMGTDLDVDDTTFESNGVECSDKESKKLMAVMEKNGGLRDKDGGIIFIMNPGKFKKLGSAITVTLRQDGRAGSTWFFNVLANPASVFSGDNTFGNLKLRTQVQDIFYFVLEFLGKKGVDVTRLTQQVKIGNINIHSVTFAQYSSPLKNEKLMRELIDRWYFMYETRLHTGERYISLLQELAMKRSVGDQYDDSIALAIYAKGDKLGKGNKLMHLCLYNKAQEKRDNEKAMGSEEEQDLEKRLRFDLTVSNYYLKNYWSLGAKPTIKGLYDYVKREYPERGWKGAVEALMTYAIERTCLSYMVTVDNPFALQHRGMMKLWEEEYKTNAGKKKVAWDPRLVTWAESLNLSLDISPDAHLIMLQGQAGLLTNTKDHTKRWLSSAKGAALYLEELSGILTKTRESKRLAQAAATLKLDFSKPTYVDQTK
jgi:hypothetical protein